MEKPYTNKKNMRIKLIFNPISGKNKESPDQLMDIIQEMQNWNLTPEPFLIEPDCDLNKVVEDAIAQGITMVVVCGGDGTVSSVARALLDTTAVLGIIPTGTRNNVALSLGIPTDLHEAIAILRTGKRTKIDIGMSNCNGTRMPFIEVCSVGLFSKLFSAGDDIQHGKILRIGDFLSTFITTPSSNIRLVLDGKSEIQHDGHVVLISNTPFIGVNNQVGLINAYHDGLLDVFVFSDLSKLNLIGKIMKETPTSEEDDPRIQHYQVRKLAIYTDPPMPVMADSIEIGQGTVEIEIIKKALTVIAPSDSAHIKSGDKVEE